MAQRTAPTGRPAAPRPGAPAPEPKAQHHRLHRPSRLVILVAASITVVAVALVVVPRLADEKAAPVDRTVDTYTVRLGDTISSVAQLHGTTKDAVEEANGLTDASSIDPGSQVEVPHPSSPDDALPTFLAADPDLMALRPTFATVATQYDVPLGLLESLAWQTSAWDADKIGEEGRTGIAQLRPSTVDYINDELVAGPALDPAVPAEDIELMAAYLDELLRQTEGSWAATVAAYRLGLSAATAQNWDPDTLGFITTVLSGASDFEAD